MSELNELVALTVLVAQLEEVRGKATDAYVLRCLDLAAKALDAATLATPDKRTIEKAHAAFDDVALGVLLRELAGKREFVFWCFVQLPHPREEFVQPPHPHESEIIERAKVLHREASGETRGRRLGVARDPQREFQLACAAFLGAVSEIDPGSLRFPWFDPRGMSVAVIRRRLADAMK